MSVRSKIPKPEPPKQAVITTTSGIEVNIGPDAVKSDKTKYAVQEMQRNLSKDIPSDILLDEPVANSTEARE